MIVKDKYWTLKSAGDEVILTYTDINNDGKSTIELALVRDEVKSLYRLLRQTYD